MIEIYDIHLETHYVRVDHVVRVFGVEASDNFFVELINGARVEVRGDEGFKVIDAIKGPVVPL